MTSDRIPRTLSRHRRDGAAFTLVELLVVIGIIGLLISILLPSLRKAREAANAAVCMSNLRQMNQAYALYAAQNKQQLPYYNWYQGKNAIGSERTWNGYWIGVLNKFGVKDGVIRCPTAPEPMPYNPPLAKGFGTMSYCWNGSFQTEGTAVRKWPKSPNIYRVGSYGFNRYVGVDGNEKKSDGTPNPNYNKNSFGSNKISALTPSTEVPLFMDANWVDFFPKPAHPDGSLDVPPPDLMGRWVTHYSNAPQEWRIMLKRHGRAINVAMADGHVRRVPLDDLYLLQWRPDRSPVAGGADWRRTRITNLPRD